MEYYEEKAKEICSSFPLLTPLLASGIFSDALRKCAALAYEDAAKESEMGRVMVLTKTNIEDGMLDDNHPVIRARAQMRMEISKALMAKAAAIRGPVKRGGQ